MPRRLLLSTGPLLLSALLTLPVTPSPSGQAPPSADLERAIAAQRALLEGDRANPSAWNDLGNLLQLHGDTDGARRAYEEALALDPDLVSAHYNLALLLQAEGSSLEALHHFREAVAADPGHAWSHYQMGRLYARQGERAAATRAYARAFAIDPRLSFPDVNPHVLDNPLLTQALLQASKIELATDSSSAPRRYEDPGRITGLLLPAPAPHPSGLSEVTPASEDGPTSTEAAAQPTQSTPPGVAVPREPQEAPPGEPPADLRSESMTAGQSPASEAEVESEREAAGSSVTSTEPARRLTPETLDSLDAPSQATPPVESAPRGGAWRQPSAPSRPTVRTPPQRNSAPGASGRSAEPRPRFVPGSRSSAQLERRLRPATPAP